MRNSNEQHQPIDRDEYERGLKERQEEHLRNVGPRVPWRPCLHDGCPNCIGTGVKHDGSACVHMISCPCPKCSPWC